MDKSVYDYLSQKDAVLAKLIEKYGYLELKEHKEDIFKTLVSTVVGQMLSKKAGDTIFARVKSLCEDITPDSILSKTPEQLKQCGLSQKKVEYIQNIADLYKKDEINPELMDKMNTRELVSYLTKIKGIGKWSAEMISLFTYANTDVWSYSDVALKNGIMRAHPEFKTLSLKRFNSLGKKYSPYQSIASMYYYRENDSK